VVGRNVAVTSNGVAVTTTGSGLMTAKTGLGQMIHDLPDGVTELGDVAIDTFNESLVFALDFTNSTVCSFKLDSLDLTLIGCTPTNSFGTSFFSAISVMGGTAVVSCGCVVCESEGGLTVFQYDTETGQLDSSPRIRNFEFDVTGQFNSVLITPTLVWINTHLLGGDFDYVHRVVELDLDEDAKTPVSLVGDSSITIDDNLQSLWIPPYFFPFSSAAFTHDSPNSTAETTYVYSTYGPGFAARAGNINNMTEDIVNSTRFDDVFGEENPGVPAIALAVNQEKALLVVGGYNETSNSSFLGLFNVSEPMEPEPMETVPISGRITSVASEGNVIAISTESGMSSFITIPQEGPLDPPIDMGPSKADKAKKAGKTSKGAKTDKKGSKKATSVITNPEEGPPSKPDKATKGEKAGKTSKGAKTDKKGKKD